MRITVHGHRPAFLRSEARSGTARPTAPAVPGETVRNVNLGFVKLKIHRQTALQASLLNEVAQQRPAVNHPQAATDTTGTEAATDAVASTDADTALPSRDELLAPWRAWQQNPVRYHERRQEAVERVAAWLDANQPTTPLNLSSLHLEDLPDPLRLPLQELDVNYNQLQHLPEGLPPTLQRLRASDNLLQALPETLPPALQVLDVSSNELRRLPQQLPASLVCLECDRNKLDALPTQWPQQLSSLMLRANHLTELPDALPSSLVAMDVTDNHLTRLPERLPPTLRDLDVTHNRLEALPAHLPESLEMLIASNNLLTSLPDTLPAALQHLNVNFNGLSALPARLPDGLAALYVNGNRLTSLPEQLPPALTFLDAIDNQLTELPRSLPLGLEHLHVTYNRTLTQLPARLPQALQSLLVGSCGLTRLPDTLPDSLQDLDASDNELTALPERLPTSLNRLMIHYNTLGTWPAHLPSSVETLQLDGNELTELPDSVPAHLRYLSLQGNQITRLPENLITQVGPDAPQQLIMLDDNPLPERVIRRLAELMNAPGYRGPQIAFSMVGQPRADTTRALPQAVADWSAQTADATQATPLAATWHTVANEPGTAAFSRFLDRLRGTVNFGNPQFRASVAEWLTHLEAHPTLRQNTFAVSEGATISCEDRVSLTFNAMRQLRLAHDVEQGHYDHRLPELLTLARGMFRLDQLEGIAREKTASLNFVDEIEVYLAFQVKLRESLALPLDTPDMRFFGVSYVTQADLDRAEARVLAAEQQGFADHLSTTWQPWQSVLQRLAPEQHAHAQDELIDAMGDEFSTRLQARLQAMELENDPDAQRTLGPQVQAEITREINGRLTRDFLANQGLLAFLDNPSTPLRR